MKYFIKQLSSFLLPISVLIIVPYLIEKDRSIDNLIALSIGLLLMIVGLILIVSTVSAFINKGKGSLAPWCPTKKLVITGWYRYIRNPMIIGVLLVLAGETVMFQSRNILIWTVVFCVINHLYFIVIEEPYLTKKFGKEYIKYKSSVPRWIPRTKPYYQNRDQKSD